MELKKQIAAVHAAKGWNAVYSFLKKNNIKHRINKVEFGLSTNQAAHECKSAWLAEDTPNFRAHAANRLVKSRRNGYSYNRIFGQEVELL